MIPFGFKRKFRQRRVENDSLYCHGVGESEYGAEPDPISGFLAQPARQYDEDVANQGDDGAIPGPKMSFWQHLNHFLFEKNPSHYSSIAPRKADGTRTKIFFFNGNGRGR
jgi:hypothetical protein